MAGAATRLGSHLRVRLLDLALVITGGVLYAAAFPPHACDLSAWIALVPLLAVAARATATGAFAAGFVYGTVFFAGIVAWVVEAVSAYFASGVVGAVAFSTLICVLFVAVYVGLFAVAARALLRRRRRWAALFGLPALWVAYELARSRLLTGLPWELLGHSQWRRTELIQIVDVGGVYAVSYLVAAVNVGVFFALCGIARAKTPRRLAHSMMPLAAAAALVALAFAYGMRAVDRELARPPGPRAVVALVQANVPSAWEWQRANAERSLLAYAALTRTTIADTRPDLVVWPEYAVTLYPERDTMLMPALAALAQRTTAGLLFGAPRLRGESGESERYFNAAYHLAPGGALAAYEKIRLVPFAEYQPMALGQAFAAEADRTFSAGTASTVFETAIGRLGVLICYEAIFPELTRDLVRAGAEVLVNISNDGWLDRAGLGASAQHLSMAVFRAVESRRFLARASSSGISGFVDPLGREFALLGVDQRGVTLGEIEARTGLTFYTRFGDAFAFACIPLGALLLAPAARRRRRR
jgi:apolipoprotein N-acyltransferase